MERRLIHPMRACLQRLAAEHDAIATGHTRLAARLDIHPQARGAIEDLQPGRIRAHRKREQARIGVRSHVDDVWSHIRVDEQIEYARVAARLHLRAALALEACAKAAAASASAIAATAAAAASFAAVLVATRRFAAERGQKLGGARM